MTSQQKISDISKVPLGVLSRVLRQAMTNGIFYEPKAGFVAHTETSRAIPQLSPLLKYQLEICLPSSVKLLQSLKQDEEAGSAGKRIPFQIAHNTDESWWVYAENSPAWMETYGQYMALITSGGAHDVSFVVEGVNWAKFGRGPIIDVSHRILDLDAGERHSHEHTGRRWGRLRRHNDRQRSSRTQGCCTRFRKSAAGRRCQDLPVIEETSVLHSSQLLRSATITEQDR